MVFQLIKMDVVFVTSIITCLALLIIQFPRSTSGELLETCYKESMLSEGSFYSNLGGHQSDSIADGQTCIDTCTSLKKLNAAIMNGSLCFCQDYVDDAIYVVTADECSIFCTNYVCGGPPAFVSTYDAFTVLPELTVDFENIKIIDYQGVEFNGTTSILFGEWLVDWGDGSSLYYAYGDEKDVYHYYADRGTYTIRAFATENPDSAVRKTITLQAPPYIVRAECNNQTAIRKDEMINCSIDLSNYQGTHQIKYTLSDSSQQTGTFLPPIEKIHHVGHAYLSDGSTLDISSDYVLLGDSINNNSRYISSVVYHAEKSGQIGIFLFKPVCQKGKTYCSNFGKCSDNCPDENGLTCGPQTVLCPSTVSCKGASCSVMTDPLENKFEVIFIRTLDLVFDEYMILLNRDEQLFIPANHHIALSCISGCPGGAATLTIQPVENYPIVTDTIGTLSRELLWQESSTGRVLFFLTLSEHEPININPVFSCLEPAPVTEVASPYTADTEQYVFESSLSLSFVVIDLLTMIEYPPEPIQLENILCQEIIEPPTVEPSFIFAFGQLFQVDVVFSKGSPKFTKISPGESPSYYSPVSPVLTSGEPILYHYDSSISGSTYTTPHLNYSKPGFYLLTGNTSNALGHVIYSTNIYIIPPITDDWVLSTDCPCYNINNQFSFKAEVESGIVAPWNATVKFYLINKLTDATVALITDYLVDFETYGAHSHISTSALTLEYLEKTVEEAGNYTLYVQISNEVSNKTFSKEVEIQQQIIDVTSEIKWDSNGTREDGLGPAQDIFISNFTIYFNLRVSHGFPKMWRLIINETSTDISQNSNLFPKILTKEGEYTIVFGAYNTIQHWIYSEPVKLQLVANINGFVLTDLETELKKPGQVKTFTAQFTIFTPLACIIVDYGDNSSLEAYGYEPRCQKVYPEVDFIAEKTVAPVKLCHIYQEEGKYKVRAVAFDAQYTFIQEISVVIADIPCTLPVVTINSKTHSLSSIPKLYRSFSIRVETSASYTCNRTVPVVRWWNLAQVNETTGASLRDIELKGVVSTYNFSQLSIEKNWLDYGVYKFSYYFNLKASSVYELLRTDYTYIEIVKSPLRAIMVEGSSSQLSRGYGQLLNLSAALLSYDPDYPQAAADLNFKWWCRQVSPDFGAIPKNSDGSYTEINLHPIPEPEAAFGLKGGGCFGVGDGMLTGNLRSILLDTASFVNPTAVYELILEVSKDTRQAVTSLLITLSRIPPPSVQITCLPALCWPSSDSLIINPSQRLALTGLCISDCKIPLLAEWTILTETRMPVNNKTQCEDDSQTVSSNTTECVPAYLTPLNETTVMMSPDFFKINNGIFFVVRFTMKTVDSTEGFCEVKIQINQPPEGGNCNVDVTKGRSLLDKFKVSCNKWSDPESLGIDYYSFYYITKEESNEVQTTIASSSLPAISLTFAVGIFPIYVQIYDVIGGSTKLFLGNVTAVLPTKEELENYDFNTVITYLSNIGDQVQVGMTVAALSSIRDKAKWFSFDENALNNLTNLEINSRLLDVATMNKDNFKQMSSSMSFGTVSQLESGINAVQQSLQGIYASKLGSLTVDMESREIAVGLIEKMTKAIPSLDISSPQELAPFLRKTMDSLSALLEGIKQTQVSAINGDGRVSPQDALEAAFWDYETFSGAEFSAPETEEERITKNVLETTRSRSKKQIDNIYNILGNITIEILKVSAVGESVEGISENGAILKIGKLSEKILQPGYSLNLKNAKGSVQLPIGMCPSRYVIQDTDCKNEFGYMFVEWPTISHFYPESSKHLSLETHIIDLEIRINEKIVPITNEPLPLIINIPRKSTHLPYPTSVNSTEYINSHLPVVYHNFNITMPESGYTLEISPLVDSLPKDLVVFVGYEKLPTGSNYLKAYKIDQFTLGSNNNYSLFVSNVENQNKTGRFYVAVARLLNYQTFSNGDKLKKSNFISYFSPSYNFRIYISGCYYFDKVNLEWTSRNLVLVKATPTLITCEAKNVAPIGSGFNPAPNKLDFEYIFANTGFTDNISLYLTIIIFLVAYIILMIWGHYMDKQDEKRRGVIPLPDNKLDDRYLYEIKFYTGPDSEASTDSDIMFIASGDYEETSYRYMPPSNKILYRRFGVDTFVMSVPRPLGPIKYLRVLHNNSGEPPLDTWQIEMVVFRDLQSGEKSIFDVNQWLAFNRDEGKTDKIFVSSDNYGDGKTLTESMYIKVNRAANQDHIFMSMFLRPLGSRFGRKERVTVCAVFVYLSMFFSAFWYTLEEDSPRNGYFDFGAFTFSMDQVISSAFSLVFVYPIVYLLTLVFKRARPKNLKKCRSIDAIEKQRMHQHTVNSSTKEYEVDVDETEPPRQKDKHPKKCIPWWTRVIAWVVSLIFILVSICLVWVLGIMWGEIKTVKWLSTFLVTFLASLVVTQWLKVVLVSIFSTTLCQYDLSADDVDCDEELPYLKHNEEWNNVSMMNMSVRRNVYKLEGVDIEKPKVAELRTRLMKEREISFVLRGIFVYTIYLIILLMIVNFRTDYNGFLIQDHLKKVFIKEGNLTHDFSKKIKNSNDFWMYTSDVLIQEFRAQRAYNGKPPYGLRGFMDDRANRMIGYPILRQVRTKRHNCLAPSPMDSIINQCSGMRGLTYEESLDFCAGWTLNETFTGACKWDEFHYQTATQLQTFYTYGRLGYYGGGGYVLKLNLPQNEMFKRFDDLQRNSWVDKNTRAVFIEFSVYNANVNLFCVCILSAEFNDGGGIVTKWRFEPVKLIASEDIIGQINTICEALFVVATCFFTLREIWNIKKQKLSYFSESWNLAELVIILVSYCAIGLYFYRSIVTDENLKEFDRTHGNGYIRMDSAALIDQYFLYCLAFIMFFCIIKMIKLLQFNKRMNVLALTIGSCWDELKIFFIAFGIIFFAFSCLFFFMFSSALETFSHIVTSVITCFQMMMGKFDFAAMNAANPLSPILFFIFSVMNSMILINIMLTIIIQSFNLIKLSLDKQENRLNVIDHAWSSFMQFLRKEQPKSVQVEINLRDKKNNEDSDDDQNAPSENFTDKVSQLVKYINEAYFDGKLDETNGKNMFLQQPTCNTSSIQERRNVTNRIILSGDD